MWGAGDAAAALVGIPLGRHKITLPGTDGKKSLEGTAAMFAVSFLAGLPVLLFIQKLPMPRAILCTMLASFAGALTELYSSSELDTVTVPVVIAVILLLTSRIG